jgi:hypothetical protein
MQPCRDHVHCVEHRRVLVPFDKRESMSITAAAKLSGKAGNTIRLWAEEYGIGRKIGGAWHISRVTLEIFPEGNKAALDAYHAGDRSNPLVRPYFERARCEALLPHSAGKVGAPARLSQRAAD